MARLEVEIDGSGARRGARTVTRSLTDIENKTKRTEGAFNGQARAIKNVERSGRALGQVFGALAAAFSVTRIVQAADSYTQLNNRLKLVTDSTEELVAVSERLFAVSQDARVSFESTAELYQRVARASDSLGKSTQDVLDVTEAVSKAITISGVSAEAANASIVQLGQGLAAGALMGEELKSVREQTPRLARAIADGLDVPIEKLRELGSAGELTAEKVFGALQSQAAVLESEFSQLDATVSQSLTVLNNSFVRFSGRLDQTLGFTNNLGRGFIALANGIDGSVQSVDDLAFAFTQLVRVGVLSLTTLDNRFDQLQNTLVGTIATLIGDDSVAEAAAAERVNIERELEAEINAITDFLDDEREQFEERRRMFEEAAELDLSAAPADAGADTGAQADNTEELTRLLREAEEAEKALQTAHEQREAALDREAEAVKNLIDPNRELNQQLETFQQLLDSGRISEDEFIEASFLIQEQMDSMGEKAAETADKMSEFTIQAARNMQTAFADFLFDPFDQGLEGLVTGFAESLRRMAAEALSQQILQGLFNAAAGGAGGGGFFASLASGFASRQTGGPLVAGQASMVNERGQEAFVPREAGQVVSNRELRQGAGASPNVNVPVEIVNITDPSAIPAAMESAQGQKAILNVIQQNPDSIRRALS